ncbi:MAG: hypothetical protein M1587_06285 [Thaumarchaeota archaeon]|nr:hypothetical protein [Nitrososphaerota archaeon]
MSGGAFAALAMPGDKRVTIASEEMTKKAMRTKVVVLPIFIFPIVMWFIEGDVTRQYR